MLYPFLKKTTLFTISFGVQIKSYAYVYLFILSDRFILGRITRSLDPDPILGKLCVWAEKFTWMGCQHILKQTFHTLTRMYGQFTVAICLPVFLTVGGNC